MELETAGFGVVAAGATSEAAYAPVPQVKVAAKAVAVSAAGIAADAAFVDNQIDV